MKNFREFKKSFDSDFFSDVEIVELFIEYRDAEILKRLVEIAKGYQDAKFKNSFEVVKNLISEFQSLTSAETLMKNGHVCGPFCEICKDLIDC